MIPINKRGSKSLTKDHHWGIYLESNLSPLIGTRNLMNQVR